MAAPPCSYGQPGAAAEAIAGNEDLIAEVLSFLPTRSLLRFKCVSRQWLRLISDHRFSLLHSSRHPNPQCSALFFFYHSRSSRPHYPTFNFVSLSGGNRSASPSSPPHFLSLLDFSRMRIVQSCNGLLLLCRWAPELEDADPTTYHICNPTSGRIAQITLPDEVNLGSQSVLGLNLAFDPSRSADYKVICVWRSSSDEDRKGIDVYSRGNGRWTRSIVGFSAPFDVEFKRGVYWNGRIHWLSHTDHTVFFDLDTDSVKPLALPPPMEDAYIERFRYFGESRGHLHLIEIRTNSVSEFQVLELEEAVDDDRHHHRNGTRIGWIVRHRVNLDVVGREFCDMFQDYRDRTGRQLRFYAFSVLSVVVVGSEDKDTVLVLSTPGKLVSYSFKTEMASLLCDVGDESDRWLPFKGYNAFQFIESLYSV